MNRPLVGDYWILNDLPASIARCEEQSAYAHIHFPDPPFCRNQKPMPHIVPTPLKWPAKVSWSGVRRFGDFNGRGGAIWQLVGERVRKLIKDNNLKGFVFRDVKFIQHKPLREQAFAPKEVQGKFWALEPELSLSVNFGAANPVEVKRLCNVCGWTEIALPKRGKLAIEPGAWDGHDAFAIPYLNCFCVSKRFRNFVRSAGLTLIDFDPLSIIESRDWREHFKGPVAERINEIVEESARGNQRVEDWYAGRLNEAELDEMFEFTDDMKASAKRHDRARRKMLRIMQKSDYGYLE